jgi:DNA-binding response OmpR family regulator
MLDLIIIDDDKNIGKVFESIFSKTDVSFEIYDCPHEGLQALIEKKPACVVLDYHMPNFRGDEVIVRSSQELLFKYCNFILMTDEEFDEMEKMKLMTLGFQYIFKKTAIHNGHFIDIVKDLVSDKRDIEAA